MTDHDIDTEPVALPRLAGRFEVEQAGPQELRIYRCDAEIGRLYQGNVPVIAARHATLRLAGTQRADDYIAGVLAGARHDAMAAMQRRVADPESLSPASG